MTYYPPPSSMPPAPPYQPPGGPMGYAPAPGWNSPLLAAALRAAVMMWVLGALGLLFGFCMTTVALVAPLDMLMKQARQSIPQAQSLHLSDSELVHLLKLLYLGMGVVLLAGSIVLLILGFFVRRGKRGAIITGIVIFVGLTLFAAFSVLSGVIQAATGNSFMLLGALLWLVLGGVFGLTILWLVQALRAGAATQQMQAYYTQLQQQPFQAHSGYGYGYQMPAQAAPSPQQSQGTLAPPPAASENPQPPQV